MDIYCPRCSEPLDTYELHEQIDSNGRQLSYTEARKIFFNPKLGCGQLFNDQPCELIESETTTKTRILAELLGDDVDGIAAISSDF